MSSDALDGGFFPASEVLDGGTVSVDASSLRLLFPFRLTPENGEVVSSFGQEADESGLWTLDAASDSVLDHARTIVKAWSCSDPLGALGIEPDHGESVELLTQVRKGQHLLTLHELRLVWFESSEVLFVSLGMKPSPSTTLHDWIDLLAATRFVSGGRAPRATFLSTGADGSQHFFWPGPTRNDRRVDITSDKPLPGKLGKDGTGVLGTLTDILLDRWAGGQQRWTSPFLRGQAITASVSTIAGVESEANRDVVRYIVRNQLHSGQPVGAGVEATTRSEHSRMPYAHGQDFLLSIEGTHFIGFDLPSTEFFTKTLPDHLGRDYLLAWLWAFQERIFLTDLVDTIANAALESEPSSRERFARVSGWSTRLARFEARGHEIHLLQREHHHRYWFAARNVLDVQALHTYVQSLIAREQDRAQADAAADEEVRRGLAAENQRNVERRIVIALAVPSIGFGFLGMNIDGLTSSDGLSLWLAILAFVLMSLVVVVVLRHARDQRTVDETPTPPARGELPSAERSA